MKALFVVLACGLLAGCASPASSPYVNASQTFRANGDAFGVPLSGAVRVGVSGGGLYIQPNFNMRQIRLTK
jgi:hypothetical protein